MPSAGLLIRFYDGIHEDDSATTVHITDGHPWQPVAELVEQARRSNLFLHEPFAHAYTAMTEEASLVVHLLRVSRGAT